MIEELINPAEISQISNLELLAKQVVEGFIIGLHKSTFHGFSVEFAEHRQYNPGKSLRNLDWKVLARYTYTYNANNKRLTELHENGSSGSWQNVSRYTYTYDANGNQVTGFGEAWNAGAWQNDFRHSYTYDANGNKLTYLYETWNAGAWLNNSHYTYTYDAQNNLLTLLSKTWNAGAWQNDTRQTYTYDAQSNLLTSLSETWNAGVWKSDYSKTYTYDANGNSITGTYEEPSGGNWAPANGTLPVYSQRATLEYFSPAHRYEVHFVSFGSVGIAPVATNTVHLLPNPTRDFIRLDFEQPTTGNLAVYNLQGMLLYQKNISQAMQSTLNLSAYLVGVYFIRISDNAGNNTVKRIVKE